MKSTVETETTVHVSAVAAVTHRLRLKTAQAVQPFHLKNLIKHKSNKAVSKEEKCTADEETTYRLVVVAMNLNNGFCAHQRFCCCLPVAVIRRHGCCSGETVIVCTKCPDVVETVECKQTKQRPRSCWRSCNSSSNTICIINRSCNDRDICWRDTKRQCKAAADAEAAVGAIISWHNISVVVIST